MFSSNFGLHFVKNAPQKAHRHTSLTHDTNPCTTAKYVSNPKCPQVFCVRNGGFRKGSNCTPLRRWQSRAWATRRSRPRWACRSRRRSCGCAVQRHSAKQVINTHLTLHGSLHKQTAPQTQTTYLPAQKGPLLILKSANGPLSIPTSLKMRPRAHFLNVPQMFKKKNTMWK